MGQMIFDSAKFPDAGIRFTPAVFHILQNFALELPDILADIEAIAACQMKDFHQFTADIQLILPTGSIARAHRTAVEVAWEPGQFCFFGDHTSVDGVKRMQWLIVLADST